MLVFKIGNLILSGFEMETLTLSTNQLFQCIIFQVASDEWYEKPIVIRIDAVSRELTNAENFPTVVICPKQTKSYVDEFGLVKVALEMIEFTCNKSLESMPDRCDSYDAITQKILDKVCKVEFIQKEKKNEE